jgi:hypothetical protein
LKIIKMVSKDASAEDMDQFMNDFLEGKFLDEKPATGKMRRHSVAVQPRRKSKTEEEGGARRAIRRTKSGDTDGIRRHRHSTGKRHSKDENQLDPQAIIRLMEKYADVDDQEKADELLHYGQKSSSSVQKPENS